MGCTGRLHRIQHWSVGLVVRVTPGQIERHPCSRYGGCNWTVCKTALTDVRVLTERGLLHTHGTTTDRRYTLRNDAP